MGEQWEWVRVETVCGRAGMSHRKGERVTGKGVCPVPGRCVRLWCGTPARLEGQARLPVGPAVGAGVYLGLDPEGSEF